MKLYTIALVILLLTVSCKKDKINKDKANENSTSFYVGTYTDGDSKGIYKYTLHKDGTIDSIGLAATTDNPSFLAKSTNGNYLLAVNEIIGKDSMGSVESFKIDGNKLNLISKKLSGGAHPCFVSINDDGYVLTANYTSGSVGLLHLNADGKLSDLLSIQQHTGRGSNPKRQEGPHAHSAWFDGNNGDVIAIDLGTNELWLSKLDTTEKKLIAKNPATLKMAPGVGPRHLAIHPNHQWIYVINEMGGTIRQVIKTNEGLYVKGPTISTLPLDFKGENTCADIHVTNDGKFIYASNRGHNSIAIFSVNQDNGQLSLVGFESVKGDGPRNFSLSPDENYLIVANQKTNNIVSFKRNKTTGMLKFIDEIKAPKPVCIVFK